MSTPSGAPVLRLRPWQRAALDAFLASPRPDFLAVATPGAGKTTFALTAAREMLAAHPEMRVIVVAPTSHLKLQWADAAARMGIDLEPTWSASHDARVRSCLSPGTGAFRSSVPRM